MGIPVWEAGISLFLQKLKNLTPRSDFIIFFTSILGFEARRMENESITSFHT